MFACQFQSIVLLFYKTMTMFNKYLPAAVSVAAYGDSPSLVLVSGRERHLMVRDSADFEITKTLRFREDDFDSASCEAPSSLGYSDMCVSMNDMDDKNTSEVLVDLFPNTDNDQSDSVYGTDFVDSYSFARKVIYAVCEDRALLSLNKAIVSSTKRKMDRLEEEGLAGSSDFLESQRKNLEASLAVACLEQVFDPLDNCIRFHMEMLVPEYLHEEVYIDIRQILIEEPELLYKDQTLKVWMREALREGSGSARASAARDVAFNGDDGLVHIGQGLMPEESLDSQEKSILIPYLRVEDQVVTYTMPALVDGVWGKKDKPALSIFVTAKTESGFVTVPLVRIYHKYWQIKVQIDHAMSTRNWARFNMLRDQNPHLNQILRDLRNMMTSIAFEIQEESLDWRFHRRPSLALPKARYMIREMQIMGRDSLVSVLVV